MSTAVLDVGEVENVAAEKVAPEYALIQMMFGGLLAQAIYSAAKLGIADLLADGPKPVEALARLSGTRGASLYRVLRALASMGVFVERDNRVFGLTSMGQQLRSNALRDAAIFMGEGWHTQVWSKI